MRQFATSPSGRTFLAGSAIALLVLAGCGGGADGEEAAVPPTVAATSTPTPAATPIPAVPLAINHIQVLGSHNSYHLKPEPALFDAIAALSPELAESIEYSHASLTEQLETFGIRQFEIDVFADPSGGLYSSPAANPLVGLADSNDPVLTQPGFKVLHTQDFDYGTTCPTLVVCLEEIQVWSDAHPSHVPIMVMLEFKSESVPDAAAAEGIELTVELRCRSRPPVDCSTPWTPRSDPCSTPSS